MRDELIRAVVSAPVTVALACSLEGRWRRRAARMTLCAVLMFAALAPHIGSWRAWVVIAVVVTMAGAAPADHEEARTPLAVVVQALLATLVAATVSDEPAAQHAVVGVSDSLGVVIVLAGYLTSVFVAGRVIGILLHPFATKLPGRTAPGIENAGRVIGWLERTLLYGLILAGAADAAAIVLAAKSVARFPAFREETFAEYYLIGTLLSFGTAAAIGVAVRAILGLPLLVAMT